MESRTRLILDVHDLRCSPILAGLAILLSSATAGALENGHHDIDPDTEIVNPDARGWEEMPGTITLVDAERTSIQIRIRTGSGNSNSLYRRVEGERNYVYLRSIPSGVDFVLEQTDLEPNRVHCYRIVQSHDDTASTDQVCARTDWRESLQGSRVNQEVSDRIIEEFDWYETRELPEGPSDRPYFYDVAGLTIDSASNDAVFWRYMEIPGALFNELRHAALTQIPEGEAVPFRAIVFLETSIR